MQQPATRMPFEPAMPWGPGDSSGFPGSLCGLFSPHPVGADAEPAIALQRALEWLQVASLTGQISERTSQATSGIRGKPPYEIDDLLRDLDLHSRSSAESGRNRVFPAR